jgi:hypothetical protein
VKGWRFRAVGLVVPVRACVPSPSVSARPDSLAEHVATASGATMRPAAPYRMPIRVMVNRKIIYVPCLSSPSQRSWRYYLCRNQGPGYARLINRETTNLIRSGDEIHLETKDLSRWNITYLRNLIVNSILSATLQRLLRSRRMKI